jgi:hypothetical protein
MKVRTRVTAPSEVDVTLQISMPMKDWAKIKTKLFGGISEGPVHELSLLIGTAIDKLATVVEEERDLS